MTPDLIICPMCGDVAPLREDDPAYWPLNWERTTCSIECEKEYRLVAPHAQDICLKCGRIDTPEAINLHRRLTGHLMKKPWEGHKSLAGNEIGPGRKCVTCGELYERTEKLNAHQRMTHHSGVVEGVFYWIAGGGNWIFVPKREPRATSPTGRWQCAECDKVSTGAGIGTHQKASGHTGRVPA